MTCTGPQRHAPNTHMIRADRALKVCAQEYHLQWYDVASMQPWLDYLERPGIPGAVMRELGPLEREL